MKKIKDSSMSTWKKFEIESITSFRQVQGGLSSPYSNTQDATYIASSGGGSFDTGWEEKKREAYQ